MGFSAGGISDGIFGHDASNSGGSGGGGAGFFFAAATEDDVLFGSVAPARVVAGTRGRSGFGSPLMNIRRSLVERTIVRVFALGDAAFLTCGASGDGGRGVRWTPV